MITLKRIELCDKSRFWNIFQKYLYEMTNYYDMDMDELGNYKYSHKNKAAEALWTNGAKKYAPVVSPYDRTESVLSFVVA